MKTWKANIFTTILATVIIITTACTPRETQAQIENETTIVQVQTQNNLADFEINGTTLIGYSGSATSIIIPDGITHIGNRAFMGQQLTDITIPDSVISIGFTSFWHNQLTNVVIPDSVTFIGAEAFAHNELTYVSIPNNITYVPDGLFRNNQLTNVTIPEGVISINGAAFSHNPIANVIIPNSVTYIGIEAFQNHRLISLTIPDSVTRISPLAFSSDFDQLTSITISANVILGDNFIGNAFSNGFDYFYNTNGKIAGDYFLNNGQWSMR